MVIHHLCSYPCLAIPIYSADLLSQEHSPIDLSAVQVHTLLHVMCQETEIAEVELQVHIALPNCNSVMIYIYILSLSSLRDECPPTMRLPAHPTLLAWMTHCKRVKSLPVSLLHP